ncbi:KilA-N domain protein [Winogradskyella phage Peternella_1]|uniref:KilA-N domain protein n=1 Tax=Winogradskyella phage Peternella_1 TaxID=2745699 RepID=A0A8E4ZG26_9CAUD|nr:transcriptional regulator [Winogradskyella phage Peternella_1]QQV91560.1 KilA-N domain protein [Winogradskyella phage Peternella_1]
MYDNKERQAPSKKEQHFTPVKFNYEGKTINFKDQKGSVMINATQMGKLFGKQPKDWLRLQSTNEFIKVLKDSQEADMPSGLFEDNKPMVQVINGGNNRGTWMHEDVALEFARWLHPKFAIWTNRHIKELLSKGSTSINQEKKGFPALPPKRKHNRLTTTRLLDIMVDVTKIENADLRLSITKKLGL